LKENGEIELGNKKEIVIGKGIEEEDTYQSESVREREVGDSFTAKR